MTASSVPIINITKKLDLLFLKPLNSRLIEPLRQQVMLSAAAKRKGLSWVVAVLVLLAIAPKKGASLLENYINSNGYRSYCSALANPC